MWNRVYLSRCRFNHWKLVLVTAGCLALIALAIFRVASPRPALVVQIARPPALLDPVRTSTYEERLVNSALYETLVTYDPDKHDSKGLLAEKWEISQGGSVYTFYLRKGLHFHDGTPVTAQAVKAGWERALDPAVSNCGYLLENVVGSDEKVKGGAKEASGLTALDQYTLKVALKQPDWTFLAVASSPRLAIVSPQAIARYGPAYGKTTGTVSGTGPFRLAAWDKEKLVLQRNRRYTGDRPQLKTLTFLAVSRPQDVIRLYEGGKLDLLAQAPAQALSSLEAKYGKKGFTIFKKPVLTLYFLGFNMAKPPFDKSDLRRAAGLAIDRGAVTKQLLGDGGKALNSFLPPELSGQGQPVSTGDAKQDQDQALQAMATAGYPYGLGLPPLSLVYNESPGHDFLAHLVQEQLDKVGINLQLKKVPWQDYEASIRSGSYQLFRLGWEADYPGPDNLLYFNFASAKKPQDNLTGYSNDGFDALLQQARGEQDPNRRQEIYRQAEATLLADAPIVPLFQQVALFGLRSGITGFDTDLLGRVDFAHLKKY